MDKYKINYIFDKEKDINDVLINFLNKELRKHIQIIYKDKESKAPLTCPQSSIKGSKNC